MLIIPWWIRFENQPIQVVSCFFSKQFLPVQITSFCQTIRGLILPAEFESTTLGYIISETASVVLFIAH